MVTVVSKQPHHSVVKETVCRNCGSVLQYVPRDIKQRTVSDYLGDRDIINYIECPECNEQVTVRGY
jgi:DNA-directed RNA polymerase subunit RPC12/RpoP